MGICTGTMSLWSRLLNIHEIMLLLRHEGKEKFNIHEIMSHERIYA